MIICPNCNASNPLGRVFCKTCDAKLPEEGLVREDLEQIAVFSWRRKIILRTINAVLGLWVAGSLVLAFWPRTQPFGEQDAGIGAARRVRRKLVALHQASTDGQKLEAELSAQELNAYIRYAVLGTVPGRNGSVQIGQDGIRVRWLMRMFQVDVNQVGGFSPILSFEVLLRASPRTGRLRIVSVRFGRLPLMWPFRGMVQDLFVGMCRTRLEWPLARRLEVVRHSPGVVVVQTIEHGFPDETTRSLAETLPLGERSDAGPGDAP